jgi:hypothetical protein
LRRNRSIVALVAFFSMFGAIIGYLEVLSGSIPLLLALAVVFNRLILTTDLQRVDGEQRPMFFRSVGETVVIVACFISSIAFMLGAKFAILTTVLGVDVMSFFRQLAVRTGSLATMQSGQRVDLGRLDGLAGVILSRGNMSAGGEMVGTALLVGGLACWLFAVYGAASLAVRAQNRRPLADVLILLGGASIVILWYLMWPNHTLVHRWFMARIASAPAAIGFVAAILVALAFYRARTARSEHEVFILPRDPVAR